jgi:mono/diheme cytochrome c family protein
MKKIATITALGIAFCIAFISCGDKRNPGRIYMPDMAYSRAYESYAKRDSSRFTMDEDSKGGLKIFYNDKPAAGTIKRGELFPYTLPNDSNGYKLSAGVKNPIENISAAEMKESERLFNINCAICHGAKGLADGPVGVRLGGVANLTLPLYVSMTDGTMYHSIHYGKNMMGSYASQLDSKQRWMIIKYIRTLQPKAAVAVETPAVKADSTKAK